MLFLARRVVHDSLREAISSFNDDIISSSHRCTAIAGIFVLLRDADRSAFIRARR